MGPLETRAAELAAAAHKGQKDKAGQPYILHPQRVAEQLETDEEKAVAWLHDVLEDTRVTEEDLRDALFSERIIEAVVALTRKDDHEGDAYYRRVAHNDLATKVKKADIADNMDPKRLQKLDEFTQKRLTAKYTNALKLISPIHTGS
jgi:(p)ppGpp synthase/HD superfamily hydrolase